MNKKISKKLSLTKETVVNLNNREMNNAKGGNLTATCPEFCETGDRCTIGCPSYVFVYCYPSRALECVTEGGYC